MTHDLSSSESFALCGKSARNVSEDGMSRALKAALDSIMMGFKIIKGLNSMERRVRYKRGE